jgi:hypothetical protein
LPEESTVTHNSCPVTLHVQTTTLAVQAAKLRDSVPKVKGRDLPSSTVQHLASYAETLGSIDHKPATLSVMFAPYAGR